MEFPIGILISLIFFIIGGIGLSISIMAVEAGFSIVVAGVASKTLDVSQYCPNCNDRVDENEIFCNTCGHNLRAKKLCDCGNQNDLNDKFCRKCGKDLLINK